MRSIEPFLILFAWYAPGFAAARAMARRGHDPLPWIYAAWIGGALTVIAALVWVRVEAHQDHHPTARRNA
ncbi:hypothetical protein [Actinospongicola halichondriae]|uniref:hypothetical protein n=1 Tax=Actinospongicola halichondriae TaxID=3236844 RepID=UPI003D3B79C0